MTIFLIISFLLSAVIIKQFDINFLINTILVTSAFFLFFSTSREFFVKRFRNLSQNIAHFGFSLLITSILLNGLFSNEFNSNMKVGDERIFNEKVVKLKEVNVTDVDNYKSLKASFEVTNKNSSFALYPEVRIYQQPLTITSEADIKTTLFSDNFLVFNILKDDGYYNVRYQYKPLMIWIWISTIFIGFGGLLSVIRKNEQKY